jgi:hypothetical protein
MEEGSDKRKKSVKYIAHNLSCTIDLDYVAVETKSIVAR